MQDLDEGRSLGPAGRITLVVLGCVLALTLPYIFLSARLGSGENAPRAATSVDRSAPRATATTTARPMPTATSSPSASAVDTSVDLTAARDSCRLANLRLRAALGAADVSLAQFEKHIDAMNLLVAGKISYAVATQFWDETRVGATQNAAAFRAADQDLRTSGPTCRVIDAADANPLPYGSVVAVQRCAAYVSKGLGAMARARTVVGTWEHHIHDMEMLRMGDITPAQATAKWNESWRTGQEQLEDYQTALGTASKARCSLS